MSFFFDAEAYARNVQNAATPADTDKALVAIMGLPQKKREKAARALENAIIKEMSEGFGDRAVQTDATRLLQKFFAVDRLLGKDTHLVTRIVTEEARKEPIGKLLEADTSSAVLERAAKRTVELREEVKALSKPRRFGM